MAAGSIAAGLMDGYVRGLGLRRQMDREDEERAAREEDRAFQREQREFTRGQRARMEREQADADAYQSSIRGIRGEGEFTDTEVDPTGFQNQRDTTVKRTRADVLRDTEGVQRRFGRLTEAEQTRSLSEADVDRARQRQLGDIQLRQAKALDAWRQAGVRYSRGDLAGALQALSSGYEAVPDGRQLVVSNGMFGLATPDGKWVEPPVPINRENVEAALSHAQRFLDPSAWAQFQGVRQGDQRITNDQNFRAAQQGIDRDRLTLARDEFDERRRGGMFTRPPTSADIFSPIGLSDDGTRILGRQGSRIVEQPVPAGYKGLFPKVTGDRPERKRPTRFVKTEDGTQTAYGEDGRPLFNLLDGGVEAPLGVSQTAWNRMQREARTAGVRAAIGEDASGNPTVGFIGRDGRAYSTVQEAAAAKPAGK